MPTPESAAFLAKKPTVPPTFDGVDYDDNKRLKQAQDAIIREQWVQVMMGRLIREELSKCYYREGVNHLEKCGHLRGQCCQSERKISEMISKQTPRERLIAKWVQPVHQGLTGFYRAVSSDARYGEGSGIPV